MTTEVFDAAVAVARRVGYRNITRRLLAEELASKPEWGRDVSRTMNYLINEGKMGELIEQVLEAKDRLALVPGARVPTLSNLWKGHDKKEIVIAAYRKAVTDGLYSLSLPKTAADTGFSVGTLRNYFGSVEGLRLEVVAEAHRNGNNTLAAEFKIGERYGSPEKIKAAAAK
jgi:hypothetical protein